MTESIRRRAAVDPAGPERLPKLCGADVELGNFVLGLERPRGTGAEASRALLREFHGFPEGSGASRWGDPASGGDEAAPGAYADGWAGRTIDEGSWQTSRYGPHTPLGVQYHTQDWGRRFLVNGGCAYVDLDHLEICLPEVVSARDFVAAWHAMLVIARQALGRANARLPHGQRIQVLVNTSDGAGNSYGSHLNVLMTARAFENLFHRKLQYLLYLAAFHASSIIYTGQGKVGSENGTSTVDYQLSQRADFLETLTGPQTTWRRPIINSRDEPLCGARHTCGGDPRCGGMARLHVIACDSTLCHVATFLKIGTLQIVLAMIEAESIDRHLVLDDPVEAVVRWSHDPSLTTPVRLASGEETTALDLQRRFLEAAARFVDLGRCQGIVPEAEAIIETWSRTLERLRDRDWDSLAGSLDWVLKRSLLVRALESRSGLTWASPEIKHLDHLYASLDGAEGLYWACERAGVVEPVAAQRAIASLVETPPENTRAWTRGTLLARAGDGEVTHANWDQVRFSMTDERGWCRSRSVDLDNPLGWTRAEAEPAFRHGASLDGILEELDALRHADSDRRRPAVRGGTGGAEGAASPPRALLH